MAEKVLFNIAGGIISSVAGPLAAEEVKLFWGVKEELKKLKNTVSTINAVLLDAEEQQEKSRLVSDWLAKLTDVLYEADDLLDTVSTNALQRELMARDKMAKKVRLFFSKSNPLVYDHRMAHKIKVIREALDAIEVDMRKFNFVPRPEETPVRVTGRDSTHSIMPDYEVIGREDDKMKIMGHLMDTNVEDNVSVLPIVGIGGLGKTTLAQQVYNDEKIQAHFELRMWICVSDPFDVKNIVERILESATRKKSESCEMDVLVNNLKENIDKKKYLLVLDDVWNEDNEQWSKLKRVLIGGATGSKILVTTRSEQVAKIMFQGEPYFLKGLGDKASLNLFKQMAFPNGEWPKNPKFQELGREILRKCAGVPLAVRTLGRMLHLKNSEREWLNFVKHDLQDIGKDDILPTLKLSYNKLPSHLKCCFANCSIYPKDYRYNKTTIIHEWIAHGFVEASPTNQCLEDVGNNYFMDLLWRSFFQDPKENYDKEVISCKMHDLMHDLAASVMARSLITTSDEKEWKINEKTRHLSVCKYLKFPIKELISQCEERIIRTFHCPNFRGEIDCEAIFSRFKFLRVLNLSQNNLKHVPNTIGQLKHLRYLDLSWSTKIKVLPHTCTKLVNLEFLNLGYCEALIGLPRGIKNLVNLRSLNLDGCQKMTYLPRGLRKSTGLQWLKQFRIDLDSPSSDNAGLSEFKELNKLGGGLIIRNLRHSKDVVTEYNVANIKEKIGLKSLMLHFSSSDEDHDNDVEDERIFEGLQPHANLMKLEMDSYRSVRLPSWILSITGLVKLRLYRCNSCQYLPHVNQLSFLKELYLREMNALVYISNCSKFSSSSSASTKNSFQSLSKIVFEECPKLKGWWGDSSLMVDSDIRLPSFPMLSKVTIKSCLMLPSLPISPQLCLLEELHLERMDALEYLFDYDRSEFSSSSSASTVDFYSSVSEIHFEKCPKLKGWWRDSSLEVDSDTRLPLFPVLSNVLIKKCHMLTFLPLSPQLRSLKKLRLEEMDALEYLFDDNRIWPSFSSSASAEDFYSSVSEIHFEECPKLKGWWGDSSLEVDSDTRLPLFPVLSNVLIKKCPMLTSLPLSPQLRSLKKLYLEEMDALEYLFDDNRIWPPFSSSASTEDFYSSVSEIHFEECPKLKGWWWRDSSLEVDRDSGHYSEKAAITSIKSQRTFPLFPQLSKVVITNCPELTSLPLSPQSGLLKEVYLYGIDAVEYVFDDDWSDSSASVEAFCPSLSRIVFERCPKLKGWWRDFSLEVNRTLPLFPKLSDVDIHNCPLLTSLPLSPLIESLGLGACSPKLLQQIMMIKMPAGIANFTLAVSSSAPLSKLKEISLWNLSDLETLQEEWLKSLICLKYLEIYCCWKLKSLSLGIQHLTALESLIIKDCPELEQLSDECGKCWEGLKSLRYLRVQSLSKWVSLPLGLQQVSTLQKLEISYCKNLTAILESIHHWKSLKEVEIQGCPRLTELPEGKQSLSSFQKLRIWGYHKLKPFSPGHQHFTALKSLTIGNYPSDELCMGWEGLKSLLFLRIEKLSKWVSLPLGLQQVSTLRALRISECEDLTIILESIHRWKSLEMLRIRNCPRLMLLPEGIQSLSSLKRLLIRGCPILLEKYKRDGGVDRHKIAHIPKLELDSNLDEERDFDREFFNMEYSCLGF